MSNSGYLFIHNVSKKKNIGNLVRSAVAFGMKEVIVVGPMKYELYGAHGSDKHIPIKHFFKLEEAKKYLSDNGVKLCGIEILPESKDVSTHPFTGDTAFMLGNEGTGLSEKQIAACDQFVYIPQYGKGTASLNVTVAGSIIMHHFALWANFKETERQSDCAKFYVEPVEQKMLVNEDIRKARLNKKDEEANIDFVNTLYGDDEEEGEESD